MKTINWIIKKSKKQIDSEGKQIPGSAFFKGRIPAGMARKLHMEIEKAGWSHNSNGVYFFSTGDGPKDISYNIKFGTNKSTQNDIIFNMCPYTW